MRNNTWCETQGWVLGHTEISALQTTSNADPRLLCSLLAGFWNTLLCRHSIATSSKARIFHRDQCGDLWSCSSWLQRCFWAAGDELQKVAARTEPCRTPGCSHAGSGQDVPSEVSTHRLRMVPRGSCPQLLSLP